MALPKFEKDILIISKLADEPNDVGGLTAEELKGKFDEGASLIKDYINEELLPKVESDIEAAAKGVTSGEGISGDILRDGSIVEDKLAPASVTTTKIATNAVTTPKMADGSVTNTKIKDEAVETTKIAAEAVTREKLAEQAVSTDKIFPGAVTTDKLYNGSVTEDKLARNAVSALYIAEIGTAWSGTAAPYTQNVVVEGLPESERIFADIMFSEAWDVAEREAEEYSKLVKMASGNGMLTVFAAEKTKIALRVKLLAIHGDGLGSGGSSGGGGENSATVNGVTLVDRSTGMTYSLYVNDGKLTLA